MKDKMFTLSAVSIELFGYVSKHKQDYLDNYGMLHFYDMCADIVNEMMDGEDYQKFLVDRRHFSINHKTCFDWYYMNLAPSMFTEDRIRRVAGLK